MLEFGTAPLAVSVTVPAEVPVPVHVPLLKNVYVTVPVAVIEFEVVTDEVSYALEPVVSVPAQDAFVAARDTAA